MEDLASRMPSLSLEKIARVTHGSGRLFAQLPGKLIQSLVMLGVMRSPEKLVITAE